MNLDTLIPKVIPGMKNIKTAKHRSKKFLVAQHSDVQHCDLKIEAKGLQKSRSSERLRMM
jgi:hypothetical protein